jgi:DNA-binding response OmpR family regulator
MSGTASGASVTVLLYSQSTEVRAAVRTAVGRRPAADLPRLDWVECTSYGEVRNELDAGGVDLAIFDGDAQPTGGMGLSRQFKNEIADCPPFIVLIAREQDRWLASWSLADSVIVRPIDPVRASASVADTLRAHLANIPAIA